MTKYTKEDLPRIAYGSREITITRADYANLLHTIVQLLHLHKFNGEGQLEIKYRADNFLDSGLTLLSKTKPIYESI